jgi:hypothetical protein
MECREMMGGEVSFQKNDPRKKKKDEGDFIRKTDDARVCLRFPSPDCRIEIQEQDKTMQARDTVGSVVCRQ